MTFKTPQWKLDSNRRWRIRNVEKLKLMVRCMEQNGAPKRLSIK